MKLVERLRKIGNFVLTGLFLLFVALGRTDSPSIALYCGVPVGVVLGTLHFFVGLYKVMYGSKTSHWASRTEAYFSLVFGVLIVLACLSVVALFVLR